jgi:hypothetical protein
MEPSRSEANSSTSSQEIPRILWSPKFHYRVHNSSPHVPILSQLKPAHSLPSYFLKFHLNIVAVSAHLSRQHKQSTCSFNCLIQSDTNADIADEPEAECIATAVVNLRTVI